MNLSGPDLRLLSIVIVFAIRHTTAEDTCPAPVSLHPCSCEPYAHSVSVRCSNITNMETLASVFERTGDFRFAYFRLEHSSVMYLPASSLQTKRFEGLMLENVKMTSLFDKVPSVANELGILFLHRAFLQRGIRWELYKNMFKLGYLDVSKTEVKSLGKSFMKYIGNKKIKNLIFSETKTSQLDDHVFANLKELMEIYVERNKIKTLKRSMFPRPAAIWNFMFQDNEIETLPEDIFSDMPFLKKVNLGNNKISKFTESTFGGIFDGLRTLTIENNPINCDCSMEWFVTRDKPGKVSGTCGKPPNKKGRKISGINKADLDYCHQSPRSGTNMLETIFDE